MRRAPVKEDLLPYEQLASFFTVVSDELFFR